MSFHDISEKYVTLALGLRQRLEMNSSKFKPEISMQEIAQRDFNKTPKHSNFKVQCKEKSLGLYKIYLSNLMSKLLLEPGNFPMCLRSKNSDAYGKFHIIYTHLNELSFLLSPYLSAEEAFLYAQKCMEDILPTFKDFLDAEDAMFKIKDEKNEHKPYSFNLLLLSNVKAYQNNPKHVFKF